jgi:NAD-dependent SIR2 family protein deacetylase
MQPYRDPQGRFARAPAPAEQQSGDEMDAMKLEMDARKQEMDAMKQEMDATKQEMDALKEEMHQLSGRLDTFSCSICLDALVQVYYRSCGHLVVCRKCHDEIQTSASANQCPMCQEVWEAFHLVFLP